MTVRGAHLAMAALAVVSFGKASAKDIGESIAAPEITTKSKVYLRGDFDLSGDMDVYPYRAQNEAMPGTSVVLCQVGDAGQVDQCVVESESPAGYGFGKAHALMVLKHGQVDLGRHPAGTWIRNTYAWKIN